MIHPGFLALTMKRLIPLLCSLIPLATLAAPPSTRFHAENAAHRTALLALYTSQGCSSCPPAEQWLARLGASDLAPDRLVPVAFHVDYWDYIGWKDRYADPRYSARQRRLAKANRLRTLYTPQFALNGRDLRPASRLDEALAEIIAQPARYRIRLTARYTADRRLSVEWDTVPALRPPHHLVLVLTENGLTDEIRSGENAGKTLSHEFVARDMATPAGSPVRLTLGDDLDTRRLALVAFVETDSGAVLQALRLDLQPPVDD